MNSASRIILITGGQRSGKSVLAEKKALSLSPRPVYVATARIGDEEFRRRVEIHQQRRGPQWTNIERTEDLGGLQLTGQVVLIDCVTMWLTNIFFANGEDCERSFEVFRNDFNKMVGHPATYIFVSNEIGLGGVSANALVRAFTDLQGRANQLVAATADEVYLNVSGIPLKIKPQQ